jgi:hypothetical protein
MRKKTSLIWTISKEDLNEIVQNSHTIADVLRCLGYVPRGKTHSILRQRLQQDDIKFNTIKRGLGLNKREQHNRCLSYALSK